MIAGLSVWHKSKLTTIQSFPQPASTTGDAVALTKCIGPCDRVNGKSQVENSRHGDDPMSTRMNTKPKTI
jgi:hypothetical protein